MKYAEFLNKCRLFWMDARTLLWERPSSWDLQSDNVVALAQLTKALEAGTHNGTPLKIEDLDLEPWLYRKKGG